MIYDERKILYWTVIVLGSALLIIILGLVSAWMDSKLGIAPPRDRE